MTKIFDLLDKVINSKCNQPKKDLIRGHLNTLPENEKRIEALKYIMDLSEDHSDPVITDALSETLIGLVNQRGEKKATKIDFDSEKIFNEACPEINRVQNLVREACLKDKEQGLVVLLREIKKHLMITDVFCGVAIQNFGVTKSAILRMNDILVSSINKREGQGNIDFLMG